MAVEIPTIDPPLAPPSRGSPGPIFRVAADAFMQRWPAQINQVRATVTGMNAAGLLIEEQAASVLGAKTLVDNATALAVAAAASALAAPGTNAASTDTRNIATVAAAGVIAGRMTAGKLYIPGQTLLQAPPPPNAANQIIYRLDTYNSANGDFTGTVISTNGSGAFSSWNIGLTASILLPLATKEDLWAGTDAGKVVTAAVMKAAEEWQLLTPASGVYTWNPAVHGWNAYANLAPGSQTLVITTAGLQQGRPYQFQPIQRASGSASTLITPTALKFGPAGVPVLSTTVSAREVIRFVPLDAACTYLDAKFTRAA